MHWKGTRFGIDLDSEGQARRLRCVQLPGSDWAAGAVKMMTALSQRRRNSHFSGDREPAVAPSHPLGGNYGPWFTPPQKMKRKKSPDFRGKPPLSWKSVDLWISPPVCEGAAPGLVNTGLSNKLCFFLHLPSSSSSSSFWDLHPPSTFSHLWPTTSWPHTPAQMVFPKINHGFLSADQQLIKRRLIKVVAVSSLFSLSIVSSLTQSLLSGRSTVCMQAFRQTCHKYSHTVSVIVIKVTWITVLALLRALSLQDRLQKVFLEFLVIQYNNGPHIFSVFSPWLL